jgi:uncharacterized membrane protein YphA (DoxX/SURF4 family)
MNQSNSVNQGVEIGYPAWQGRAAEAASLLLGFLLLLSALTKIAAPQGFLGVVQQFGLIPEALILPLATGVVGLELALSVLLVTGLFRRTAAWITLMLLMVFVLVMAEAIRRNFEHCGCFGESIQIPPRIEIWFDVLLIGLTLLVIWRGRERSFGGPALRHGLAWGTLCLGAFLFLAGGPVAAGDDGSFEPSVQDLDLLAGADPPLTLPENGLLFLFSADCDHCWSFAGGVQMTHDRLEDFEVHGVTFSDELELAEFEEAFSPSYPIHRISKAAFDELIDEYPGAIWFQDGAVAGAWTGRVPSHRELSDLGGYTIRSLAESPGEERGVSPATPAQLFGGTATGRH